MATLLNDDREPSLIDLSRLVKREIVLEKGSFISSELELVAEGAQEV